MKLTKDDYLVSYLLLRQLIGILGIVLPFALILGNHFLGNESWLQPSISHYFYSYMHFAFVGVLFILGAILISYREKEYKLASQVSTFAGAFAFCVAIFPTEYKDFNDNAYIVTSNWEPWFKWVHFGSAFCLFSCFAIFCFVIFQKADKDKDLKPVEFDEKKKLRNLIYKLCGWGIVISIVMIGSCTLYEHLSHKSTLFTKYSTFLFETTALLCFGNSWLLKGSVNWKTDESPILRKIVAPVR